MSRSGTPEIRAIYQDRLSDWRRNAACRGLSPSLWYPERGDTGTQAKAVCRGCDVKGECLEYALASGQKWGVWGGLSERELRKLRRRRLRVVA